MGELRSKLLVFVRRGFTTYRSPEPYMYRLLADLLNYGLNQRSYATVRILQSPSDQTGQTSDSYYQEAHYTQMAAGGRTGPQNTVDSCKNFLGLVVKENAGCLYSTGCSYVDDPFTVGITAYWTPTQAAAKINPEIRSYIENEFSKYPRTGRMGVLQMDYIDAYLMQLIYLSNFNRSALFP